MSQPNRFTPERYAAIDAELPRIEAYLSALVAEISSAAPLGRRHHDYWVAFNAAQQVARLRQTLLEAQQQRRAAEGR